MNRIPTRSVRGRSRRRNQRVPEPHDELPVNRASVPTSVILSKIDEIEARCQAADASLKRLLAQVLLLPSFLLRRR